MRRRGSGFLGSRSTDDGEGGLGGRRRGHVSAAALAGSAL